MNLRRCTIAFVLLSMIACNNSKVNQTKESAFNDLYELSEMSLLMEDLHRFYKDKRDLVTENQAIGELPKDLDKIYYAEMTDGFERNELLRNFSDVFVNNVNLLHNSDSQNKVQLYNNMVNSCIACHKSEVGCIGPIPRIKKLLIQ